MNPAERESRARGDSAHFHSGLMRGSKTSRWVLIYLTAGAGKPTFRASAPRVRSTRQEPTASCAGVRRQQYRERELTLSIFPWPPPDAHEVRVQLWGQPRRHTHADADHDQHLQSGRDGADGTTELSLGGRSSSSTVSYPGSAWPRRTLGSTRRGTVKATNARHHTSPRAVNVRLRPERRRPDAEVSLSGSVVNATCLRDFVRSVIIMRYFLDNR